jgi:hypothetical protein
MSTLERVGAWMRERAKLVFGLDTRSLAVTRISLGLIVVLDVLNRVSDYRFFYTEAGALPRMALLQHLQRREHISLFMASGSDWWAGACFAIEAAAAIAFLVGYRTKLANLVVWAMVIGSHARGSILLQSGDVVLRLLLFWCLFLPMGARVSIDSVRKRIVHAPPRHVLGIATTAIQFQMAAIYIWTVMLKTGAAWRNGEAVWYALNVDHFAKQPLAGMLLEHQEVWSGLTHLTFWFEMIGPWLLLVPFFFGPTRVVAVGGFIFMHLGFWAGLEIGLFPWICIAGWVALMPGWLWQKLGWVVPDGDAHDAVIGMPWARRATSRWGTGLRYAVSQSPALFFLWMAFQWNMSTVDGKNWAVPPSVRWVGHTLRLDQKWNMFAPFPLKDDGWFVIPGELVSGEFVELWQGGEVAWATDEEKATWTKATEAPSKDQTKAYNLSRAKPELISAMYPNQRWRKYMRNLWQKRYKKMRLYYGKALCVEWNREHTGREKLRRFNMVYMKEVTPKPGKTTEVVPVQIWTHDCFKATQVGEKKDKADATKAKADAVRRAAGLRRASDRKDKVETVPVAPLVKDAQSSAVPLPEGATLPVRPGTGPIAPPEPRTPPARPEGDAAPVADVPAPPAP